MKKLLILLVLFGGVGYGVYWWWQEQARLQHVGPRKPVTAKLDKGDVTEKVSATGKVMPREKILVSTDVPLGIIKGLNPDAEPGKFVKEGTWLIKLDDRYAKAKVDQAEAALKNAFAARDQAISSKQEALAGVDFAKEQAAATAADLAYKIKLGGASVASGQVEAAKLANSAAEKLVKQVESKISAAEAAIKTAEAGVKTAEAGIAVAKLGVEMMTINAPRDGIMLEKKVLLGQPVAPQNSPLFIMMPKGDDWEIYAMVSESDIAKVQKDQTVEFTADAYSGKNVRYRGKVLKKDLVPTQLTSGSSFGLGLSGPTNFGITISVIHEPGLDKDFPLLSGMTANVDVMVNSVKGVLRVPKAVTQYQPSTISKEDKDRIDEATRDQWQAIWIWTAAQRAELVFIKTGVDDGAFMEVKEVQSGPNMPKLEPGTEVVIEDPPPEPERSWFSRLSGGGDKPLNIPIR